MFLTLMNQQHYSTAPGSLKKFFSIQNQQHYLTAPGFLSFTIILRIFSSRYFLSLTINHQHYRTASGFFLLREFTQGFRVKTLLYSRAISTTVQLLVFLKKSFLFQIQTISTISQLLVSQTFITNHQHYHTASGFR